MQCNLKENTKGKFGENLVSMGEGSGGHTKKKKKKEILEQNINMDMLKVSVGDA